MITISELAATKFKDSLANIGEEELFLRISAQMSDAQGVVYNIGFDDEKADDLHHESSGINMVFDEKTQTLCANLQIDFGQLEGEEQFILSNPQDAKKDPSSCGTTPNSSSCGGSCTCG